MAKSKSSGATARRPIPFSGQVKVKGGEGYQPTLQKVGNSDFYQDEYGINNIKKITQGAYAGAYRAEMSPTPKDGIPEGVQLPPTEVSYHSSLEDARNSIRAYHHRLQEYKKTR